MLIKDETARQCRDAFARVPELETGLAAALASKTILEAQIATLQKERRELEQNKSDQDAETRRELKELRAEILELTRIARKRTKICFIC